MKNDIAVLGERLNIPARHSHRCAKKIHYLHETTISSEETKKCRVKKDYGLKKTNLTRTESLKKSTESSRDYRKVSTLKRKQALLTSKITSIMDETLSTVNNTPIVFAQEIRITENEMFIPPIAEIIPVKQERAPPEIKKFNRKRYLYGYPGRNSKTNIKNKKLKQ
jgi:hypothetical protein